MSNDDKRSTPGERPVSLGEVIDRVGGAFRAAGFHPYYVVVPGEAPGEQHVGVWHGRLRGGHVPARRPGGGEGTSAGHQGLTAAPSEGHPDRPGRRQRLAHGRRPGWRSPARSPANCSPPFTGQPARRRTPRPSPPTSALAHCRALRSKRPMPLVERSRRERAVAECEDACAPRRHLPHTRARSRPFESVDEMGRHAAPRVGDDHRSSGHDHLRERTSPWREPSTRRGSHGSAPCPPGRCSSSTTTTSAQPGRRRKQGATRPR